MLSLIPSLLLFILSFFHSFIHSFLPSDLPSAIPSVYLFFVAKLHRILFPAQTNPLGFLLPTVSSNFGNFRPGTGWALSV
jgi:hypothetical protein